MPAVKDKNKQDLNLLPQNIEAEEAVLGAILVNPRVLTKVVETLKADSFYKPAHRYIYEAMLQLFKRPSSVMIYQPWSSNSINLIRSFCSSVMFT